MPHYKITWDAGYGESEEIIDADSYDEANYEAYENCKQEAELNASYGANELTRDDVIEMGRNPEDYGFDPLTEDEQ